MNLDERAVMLHRAFPHMRITGQYLGKIFKKHKIKKKTIKIEKYYMIKKSHHIHAQIRRAKEELEEVY